MIYSEYRSNHDQYVDPTIKVGVLPSHDGPSHRGFDRTQILLLSLEETWQLHFFYIRIFGVVASKFLSNFQHKPKIILFFLNASRFLTRDEVWVDGMD